MVDEKLKEQYAKAVEHSDDWSDTRMTQAAQTFRYRNLIRHIQAILPEASDDPAFEAELLKDLGYFQEMNEQPHESERSLNRALRAYERLDDNVGVLETLNLLGDLRRDYSRFKPALRYYEKAITRAGRDPDCADAKADSHWGIADICRFTGRYDDALRHLKASETICKRTASTEGLSNVLWVRGYVWICRGHYKRARRCFQRILDLCDQGELDELHRIGSLGALADVYRLTGRITEALDLYKHVEEEMGRQEDNAQRAWILAVWALALLQTDEADKALEHADKAERIARRLTDTLSVVWAVQAKAEAHRALGQLDKATAYYHETRDTARRLGCKLELAHAHLGLAEIARDEGRSPVKEYGVAQRIYQSLGTGWGITVCQRRTFFWTTRDTSLVRLNFP